MCSFLIGLILFFLHNSVALCNDKIDVEFINQQSVPYTVYTISDAARLIVSEALGNGPCAERSIYNKHQMYALVPGESKKWIIQTDYILNKASKLDREYDILGSEPLSSAPYLQTGDIKIALDLRKIRRGAFYPKMRQISVSNVLNEKPNHIVKVLLHEMTHARQQSDMCFNILSIEPVAYTPKITGAFSEYYNDPKEVIARLVSETLISNKLEKLPEYTKLLLSSLRRTK